MFVFLLAVAAMEILGIAIIFPILSIIFESEKNESHAIFSVLKFLRIDHDLLHLLSALVFVTFLKSTIILISKWQVGVAVANLGLDIRNQLVASICTVEWPYFVQKPAGELANVVTSQIDAATNIYFHAARFGSDFIVALFFILFASILSPTIAILAFLISPLLMYSLRWFLQLASRSGRYQTALLQDLSRLMVDRLSSMKYLRASSEESVLATTLDNTSQRFAKAIKMDVFAKEGVSACFEPLVVLSMATGIYFLLMILGENKSEVFLLAIIFQRIMSKIGNMQTSLQGVVRCRGFYETVMNTIQEIDDRKEEWNGDQTPTLNSSLSLNSVGFQHGENIVLKDININVLAGSFTAITGPSGSGKTTIVDLIIGLQNPNYGTITVDEIPLKNLNIKMWRNLIAYVPQDPVLFNDSLWNNLTLYKNATSESDVWEALSQVKLDAHIRALPDGLHTVVGERGAALSGGQRQRLVIARALLRMPKLIILDEATSGLDLKTENQILALVSALDMTKISVSHQPAVLRYADQVITLIPQTEKQGSANSESLP